MMKSKQLLTNVLALSLGLGLVACKSIPNEQTKILLNLNQQVQRLKKSN